MSQLRVSGPLSSSDTKEFKHRYYEAVRIITAKAERSHFSNIRHGLEVEGFVVDEASYRLRYDFVSPFLQDVSDPSFGDESGVFQLEISPPPSELAPGAFSKLMLDLAGRKHTIALAAQDKGARFIQTSLPPFLEARPELNDQNFNRGPLYDLQVEFWQRYDSEHGYIRPDYDVCDHTGKVVCTFQDNVLSLAFVCGLHTNFQPLNSQHTLKCFNAAQVLTPYLVALSANGDFLNARLAKSDYRLHVGMTSEVLLDEDSHNDCGLFPFYIRSLDEYFFRHLLKTPIFILEDSSLPPYQNAIDSFRQTSWSFIQLKSIAGATVIEYRPMSVQATSELNAALHQYALLTILYFAENLPELEDLPPIQLVHEELLAATQDGVKANVSLFNIRRSVVEWFGELTPLLQRFCVEKGYMNVPEFTEICTILSQKFAAGFAASNHLTHFLESSHSDRRL